MKIENKSMTLMRYVININENAFKILFWLSPISETSNWIKTIFKAFLAYINNSFLNIVITVKFDEIF